MAATRPQHETPVTAEEQSCRDVVDAVQIFFMATSTKRQRIALVHCKEALMSLLKVPITVAALTIGPAIAAAQPQDRPRAVSPTRSAAPIAEQPPRQTEPSPSTERDPRRHARTAEATQSNATVWDQTKAMTRKQWNKARKTWALERGKWRDCNRQSRARKLSAPKTSFIASCMAT
jgi:hypothetical protein